MHDSNDLQPQLTGPLTSSRLGCTVASLTRMTYVSAVVGVGPTVNVAVKGMMVKVQE